jgi:DNA-binding transcriptional MerR regulator
MEGPVQEAAGASGRPRANGRSSKSAGAFRTISEVADELDVAQHVLRFWESKFPQVRPLKRGGGRRYYRPEDVDLLRRIRSLLYEEGYTIKGAQKLLKGQRRPPTGRNAGANNRSAADHASDGGQHEAETALQPDSDVERVVLEPALRETLAGMRDELAELRELLKKFTG